MNRILLLCGLVGFGSIVYADKIVVNRSVNSPLWVGNTSAHEMLGRGINVRNRSDKTIRRVTIEIRRRNAGEPESVTVEEATVGLAPGKNGRVTIPNARPTGSAEVTLTVVGIEYEDGSRWTAPRT